MHIQYTHWLRSHLKSVWGDVNWMHIEPIHLWRWIRTKSKPNSLFIHRITIKSRTVTPPRTATSSKLSFLGHHTRCVCCLRKELRWPVMLGQNWIDAAKKETVYQVVSCTCSLSKFTLHVFYYMYQRQGTVREVIGWTLVCVSRHLECWLDKPRVEIITWAAVGVTNQQQFGYNSVSKFWQCEHDRCGFDSHSMCIGWMWIQFAFKLNQVWNVKRP